MAEKKQQTNKSQIIIEPGKELNLKLRELKEHSSCQINSNGVKYICSGLSKKIKIEIMGVAGNDLGAFMDGPEIKVNGDAQDGVGNTMNSGKITIHGDAGDILAYSMRGGKIFVKGNVGYRACIHMKEYQTQIPIVIIGGTAGGFLSEYMAGGILIVLGLNGPSTSDYLGTGMYGGIIYWRGEIEKEKVSKEIEILPTEKKDIETIKKLLKEYCEEFSLDIKKILNPKFLKLKPKSNRPHKNLYVSEVN